MEPIYFFYMVLPLAVLVVFLVGLILYYSRKEEDEYEKLKDFKEISAFRKTGRRKFFEYEKQNKTC